MVQAGRPIHHWLHSTTRAPLCNFLYGFDVDLDIDRLATAAKRHALYRSHVAVITPPREGHMSIRRHHVVGRIEADPARARHKDRHPRMRCLRAMYLRPTADISTDI